ncbi:MAG: cupin domain-containing protein [Candidatus Binatia bacterium]
MDLTVKNIFAHRPQASEGENFSTLFDSSSVKIEKIVSHLDSSPAGFWYDQAEDEWVILMRGTAALEFASGEIVEMKDGDYLVIPRGVRHRVARTGENTVWLAVHLK